MKFVASAFRVVASLIVIFVVAYALMEVGGHLFGDRVYLKNDYQCNIVVMDEHESTSVSIGQVALIKSGLMERTPTLLIAADSKPVLHGLHFSINQIQARNTPPIFVPAFWRTYTFSGSKLVYILSSNGNLKLHYPNTGEENPKQPIGLPLEGRKITSCENSAQH
jgi:hypothetical protein